MKFSARLLPRHFRVPFLTSVVFVMVNKVVPISLGHTRLIKVAVQELSGEN